LSAASHWRWLERGRRALVRIERLPILSDAPTRAFPASETKPPQNPTLRDFAQFGSPCRRRSIASFRAARLPRFDRQVGVQVYS